MPATVLALLDRIELDRHNMAYAFDALQRADTERLALLDEAIILRPLLSSARAWAAAIERQDMDAIEKAEKELIVAIVACS